MVREVKILPGSAGVRLGERIVEYLNNRHPEDDTIYELDIPQVQKFSNDNTFIKLRNSVRESDVFIIQSSGAPVNDRLMELLATIDACRRASAGRINVILPYFPYSRSDKIDQFGIALTARLVADLLVAAGAQRIITMDLHADQIQGFFNIAVDHLKATSLLAHYVEDHFLQGLTPEVRQARWAVVAPDAGAAKRAQIFAKALGLDLVVVLKQRLGNNDKSELTHVIGEVQGKRCFIFDDEIDTGRTLVNTIDSLCENHGMLEAIAVVSHGVFSGPSLKVLEEAKNVRAVVATDTLELPQLGELRKVRYRKDDQMIEEEIRVTKIHECTVAGLFAATVRAVHLGQSVSEVFDHWKIGQQKVNLFEDEV